MKPYQYALTALAAVTCHWASAQTPVVASTPASASAASTASEEPRIIRGNDRMTAPSPAVAPIVGAPSAFNFEETPIADVVRVVLGDILKVNYVLYPPLTGTVTLSTREAVTPDQAAYLLESALQANGLIMARDARGTYHVGRPDAVKGAGSASRQVISGTVLQPGYGSIIVPLQFIGATEMATILRPMLPPEALARVDTVRNLLVLVGTRSQAEGWLDMVNTFDVDLLKGMSVGVFPLKHASTREVEAALRLMGVGGAAEASPGAGSSTRPASTPTPGSAAAQAPVTSNPLLGALRVMPIERINSVLVVASRAAQLDEARRWIEKLDKPSDNSAEPQLFVYPVQNGSAQHLASVLNGIFGSGGGVTPSSGTGVAPRLPTTSAAGGGVNLTSTANTLGSNQQNAARGNAPTPNAVVVTQSGVRVMADDRNNAVLIYGSRSDYNRIEAALKRLDLPPTQVLIEASIVEVTLGDDLSYGVQWMFNDNTRGGLQGTGVLSGSTGGVPQGVSSGFSYTLRNSLGNVRAVLNALAGKSLLNVISSPSLMVLDNHTATISAGTQQPVRTGDIFNANGLISSTIQYRDTGVSLSVTPSVNAGDMITMDINQSVTDVGAPDAGSTGQVTFNQRQISSKVAVRSGETLVLGGLIRDSSKAGGSGVPGLQDIPLIGALFGTKTKKIERTELLVVITPRVVRSDQGIRELSQELRERMRSGLTGREPSGSTSGTASKRSED